MKSKLILAMTTALAITGSPSAQASLVNYNVQEIFKEPAYGGKQNTVFDGTFTYDTVAKTITNLTGTLSEAMTPKTLGGPQTLLNLNFNPVASKSDGKGGVIASAFLLNTTSIFSDGNYNTNAYIENGNQNAYITINVSAAQLSGTNTMLASTSFGNLYYGDCQPGGMMNNWCMTGWGSAGGTNTSSGSMGGYPISEKVWGATPASVPLPPAAWTFLTGMIGLLFFGKRRNRI